MKECFGTTLYTCQFAGRSSFLSRRPFTSMLIPLAGEHDSPNSIVPPVVADVGSSCGGKARVFQVRNISFAVQSHGRCVRK